MAAVEYPAGANESGFQDAQSIAKEQQGILNDSSFELTYSFEVLSGPDEGQSASLVTRYAGEKSLTEISSQRNTSIWTTSEGAALKASADGETQYAYFDRNASFFGSAYRHYGLSLSPTLVGQYLNGFTFEATDTYEENGQRFVEYESTGVNESYAEQSRTPDYATGNVTLVMRTDGLVTSIDGTMTVNTSSGQSKRTASYEVSGVGSTSVEPPAWIEEEIPQVSTELVADGKAIAVTHEGGPTIEEGGLTVRAGGAGQAELTGFAEGDTVYVTATGDRELNLTVTSEQPSPGGDAVDFTESNRAVLSIQSEKASLTLLVFRETES